jgi:hypothetical protein
MSSGPGALGTGGQLDRGEKVTAVPAVTPIGALPFSFLAEACASTASVGA